jgi:hypothetical protein
VAVPHVMDAAQRLQRHVHVEGPRTWSVEMHAEAVLPGLARDAGDAEGEAVPLQCDQITKVDSPPPRRLPGRSRRQ